MTDAELQAIQRAGELRAREQVKREIRLLNECQSRFSSLAKAIVTRTAGLRSFGLMDANDALDTVVMEMTRELEAKLGEATDGSERT